MFPFRIVRQLNIDGNSWYLPLSYPWHFSIPYFLKHRKVNLRKNSAKWDNKLSIENSDTPLNHKLFLLQEFFWNRAQNVSLTKIFSTMRKKNSTEVFDTSFPPPYPRSFSISERFWNTEVFLYEIIRHCHTKIFTENRDSPLVGAYFFDRRKFLKTKRVPLRNDSVPRDKTVWT